MPTKRIDPPLEVDAKSVRIDEVVIDGWDREGEPLSRAALIVTGHVPAITGLEIGCVSDGEYGMLVRVVECGFDESGRVTEDTLDAEQLLDPAQCRIAAALLLAYANGQLVGPTDVICPTCHGSGEWRDPPVGMEECERCATTGRISILDSNFMKTHGIR